MTLKVSRSMYFIMQWGILYSTFDEIENSSSRLSRFLIILIENQKTKYVPHYIELLKRTLMMNILILQGGHDE